MFTNYSFSFSNKIVSQCGVQSCFDEHWPLRHTQLLYLSLIFTMLLTQFLRCISFRDWFRRDIIFHIIIFLWSQFYSLTLRCIFVIIINVLVYQNLIMVVCLNC